MNAEDTRDIFSRLEYWSVSDIKINFGEKRLIVPDFVIINLMRHT